MGYRLFKALCIGIFLISFIVHSLLVSVSLGARIFLKTLCTCEHSSFPHTHSYLSSQEEIFSESFFELFDSTSQVANLVELENVPKQEHPLQPHFCPHKKSNQNLEKVTLVLSAFQVVKQTNLFFPPVNVLLYILKERKPFIPKGYKFLIIKPPKFI